MFSGQELEGEKLLLRRLINTMKNWQVLFVDGDLATLDQALSALQIKLETPLCLPGSHKNSTENMSSLEGSHGEDFFVAAVRIESEDRLPATTTSTSLVDYPNLLVSEL